jgi:hypothetical protein
MSSPDRPLLPRILCATALILTAGLYFAGPAGARPASAIGLPGRDFYPGWRPCSAERSYEAKNLYGYIDGGAELFLEFGFDELVVQRYCHGNDEIGLDLYRMATPDAALGIYLARKGVEQPVEGVSCRNTGSNWQITALRGRHYIQITNLSGGEQLLPVMVKLMQDLITAIPEEAARDWGAGMPADCIPGTELLAVGPYSLQMIYTFGEGDVLQLGGRVTAVCMERPAADQKICTYLRIVYPDSNAARAALTNTIAGLDPYLTPVGSAGDTLTFKDYKQEYGRIARSGEILHIELHLIHL